MHAVSMGLAHMPSNYISLKQAEEVAVGLPDGVTLGPYRNVFAVVNECTVPRPTRGTGLAPVSAALPGRAAWKGPQAAGACQLRPTQDAEPGCGADLVSNLTLSDATLDCGNQPGTCASVGLLCFADSADKLPRLQLANDIIRLHRVRASCAGGWGLGACCTTPAAAPDGTPCVQVNRYNGRLQLQAKVGTASYLLFHGSPQAGRPSLCSIACLAARRELSEVCASAGQRRALSEVL